MTAARFALDGQGPLFKQIQRAVTAQILNGGYKLGDRLPSEAELTQIFQASRQTVNKAISELAKHGLVERNRRAGTVVSWRFQERFVLPLQDVWDYVSSSGRLYRYQMLARREVRNGEGGETWTALPAEARLLFIEAVHLCDGLPIQLESRYISLDAVPWVEAESFTETAPGKWLLNNIPWSEAEHRLRASVAEGELAAKLGVAPGTACLVIDRQTFQLGRPITRVQLVHPGDRFSIFGQLSFGG